MSFSSKIKEELSRTRIEGRSAKVALLAGISKSIGKIYLANGVSLKIMTESSVVAKLVHIQLKKTFKLDSHLGSSDNSSFSNKRIYEIYVENAESILIEMGLLEKNNSGKTYVDDIPIQFRDDIFRYYLRGLFLGSGSITDPEKGYHMELVFRDENFTKRLVDIVNDYYDLCSKYIKRNNEYLLYIKDSDKIADFINVVGAINCLFDYENVRVLKQIRNNVNRAVNCDTANIAKTTSAAKIQIEAINKLDDRGILAELGEKYLEIAEIRRLNPEAALSEIADMTNPPISKSGVNHRLKKIIKIASELD